MIASLPPEQQQLGAFMAALMGKNSNDIAEVGALVRRQERLDKVESG